MISKRKASSIGAICTFMGSNEGFDSHVRPIAVQWGKILADNNIRLVYGGSCVGLMGACAQSVLDNGGQVTGVIPKFLNGREPPLAAVQDLIVTEDMHERKQIMSDRADAFVVLRGGAGTLEELAEQATWKQVGLHSKPILILNDDGYWDPIFQFYDNARRKGQIREDMPVEILEASHVEDILPILHGTMQCPVRLRPMLVSSG